MEQWRGMKCISEGDVWIMLPGVAADMALATLHICRLGAIPGGRGLVRHRTRELGKAIYTKYDRRERCRQ
jgi:hypothetical protein